MEGTGLGLGIRDEAGANEEQVISTVSDMREGTDQEGDQAHLDPQPSAEKATSGHFDTLGPSSSLWDTRATSGDRDGSPEPPQHVQSLVSPKKHELGSLHKRRASTSPQKFNTGKFEPLPLRLESGSDEPPRKRTRLENKLEISYDSAGTPRVASITPTYTLPSGRKVSAPKLLNPNRPTRNSNKKFSVFNAILRNDEVLHRLVSFLPMPALISLYAISKPFHYLFNGAYTAFILSSMRNWAPDSDKIYPWRCYQHLCIKDPRIRQKSAWKGKEAKKPHEDLRDIPSIRWLQMVIWRHGVCKDMLLRLAAHGLRCPHGTLEAVKRMWFVMDLPLNAHRLAICRTESYISKRTIFCATLFFLKVDMFFTDPKGPVFAMNGPQTNRRMYPDAWQNCGYVGCDLRELLTAEKSLTPLWRVLRGWSPDLKEFTRPINRLDILKLWVRHCYHLPSDVPEHVKRQSIMGIPWYEVGTAGLERTGVSVYKLSDATGERDGEIGAIINPGVTSKQTQHNHQNQQLLYPHKNRMLLPKEAQRAPLLRPEELVMREGIRRQMRLHQQWVRMMLYGFCDDLGRNLARRTERELLEWSNGNWEPKSRFSSDEEYVKDVEKKRKAKEEAEKLKGHRQGHDGSTSAGVGEGVVAARPFR